MRVLLFLTLITLILSCSEQPLMYEPQTRVQQGVPSGQIGPQIDTLFSIPTNWITDTLGLDPTRSSVHVIGLIQRTDGWMTMRVSLLTSPISLLSALFTLTL